MVYRFSHPKIGSFRAILGSRTKRALVTFAYTEFLNEYKRFPTTEELVSCVNELFLTEGISLEPRDVETQLQDGLSRLSEPHASVRGSYTCENFTVDYSMRSITSNGRTVRLSPKELDLLYVLILNEGHFISVDGILKAVWGSEHDGNKEYVRAYIYNLRNKFGKDGRRIILNDPMTGYAVMTSKLRI